MPLSRRYDLVSRLLRFQSTAKFESSHGLKGFHGFIDFYSYLLQAHADAWMGAYGYIYNTASMLSSGTKDMVCFTNFACFSHKKAVPSMFMKLNPTVDIII